MDIELRKDNSKDYLPLIKKNNSNTESIINKTIKNFNQFVNNNGYLALNESVITDFITAINDNQNYSVATKNSYKSSLKSGLKSFYSNNLKMLTVIDSLFKKLPSFKKQSNAVVNCLDKYDILKMIDNSNKRQGLIIKFLFSTGCRVSEMINIPLSKCSNKNNYYEITIIGKGNKERIIKITDSLFNEIKEIFKSKTFLFETKTNNKLNRINISKMISKVGSKALNKKVYPHLLRHSFANTLLKDKKESLKATSDYLGHSNTSITADFYIHDKAKIESVLSVL